MSDELIKRKAVIRTTFDLCPDTTSEGSYDEYAVSCLCGAVEMIKRLPIVDAIPIEWLTNRMIQADDECDLEMRDCIGALISQFKREKNNA